MRVLIAAFVGLAVLVVAGLFAAPFLIDAESHRDTIARQARALLGQPVTLDGPIGFRLLPTPRLRAEAVAVQSAEQDLPPVLLARAVDIRLSIASLLLGDVVANRVTLISPQLNLVTLANGRRNHAGIGHLAGMLGQPGGGGGAGGGGFGDADADAPIRHLDFVGGLISMRNARNGLDLTLAEMTGTLDAARDGRPPTLRMTGRMTGLPLAVEINATAPEAGTRLSVVLNDETGGTATFRGKASPDGPGRMRGSLTAESPDLLASLRLLGIDLTDDRIPDPVPGTVNGDMTVADDALVLEKMIFDFAGIEGRGRVTASLPGGQGGSDAPVLDVSIGFEQLNGDDLLRRAAPLLSGDGGPGPALPTGVTAALRLDVGVVALGGSQLRQFAFDAGLSRGELAIGRLSALLPGGSDLAFTGKLRTPTGHPRLDGTLEAATDNLRALLDWTGLPVTDQAADRLRNASITATISATDDVIQAYGLDMRLDRSRVSGGFAVAVRERPSFSLDLRIDQLNADAYLQALGLTGHLRRITGNNGPPDVGFLGDLDTNSRLAVDQLWLNGRTYSDLTLDASLIGGQLSLNGLQLYLPGGARLTLDGSLDNPEDPRFALSGTGSGDDLRAVLLAFGLPLDSVAARFGSFDAGFGLEGSFEAVQLTSRIELAAARLVVEGRAGNWLTDPRFDLTIAVDRARLLSGLDLLFPRLRWPGHLDDTMVANLRLDGTAADYRLLGHVDALSGRMELDGNISGPAEQRRFRGGVALRHQNLSALAVALLPDLSPMVASTGPVELLGTLLIEPGALEISGMELTSAPLSLTGGLRWDNRARRLTGALTAGNVALDPLLPAADSGAALAALQSDTAQRWSRAPLDLLWMTRMQGALDLRLERLEVRGLTLHDLAGSASLEAGSLSISGLGARMADGEVKGSLRLTGGARPELDLDLAWRDSDIGALTTLATATGVITGRGDLDLSLRARGVAPFDMARAAEGEMRLAMPSAAVQGIDVPAWLQVTSDDAAEAALRGGQTVFSGFQANLAIREGIISPAEPVSIGAGAARSIWRGNADVADWTLDLEALLQSPGESARSTLLSFTGPLNQPRLRIAPQP
ncbi:MAG: AsmA family protein [Minwuia sp.]|nr:AsmA family protein [Minwuia sp.]